MTCSQILYYKVQIYKVQSTDMQYLEPIVFYSLLMQCHDDKRKL